LCETRNEYSYPIFPKAEVALNTEEAICIAFERIESGTTTLIALEYSGEKTIKHLIQTNRTRSNHADSQVRIFKTWSGPKKKAV